MRLPLRRLARSRIAWTLAVLLSVAAVASIVVIVQLRAQERQIGAGVSIDGKGARSDLHARRVDDGALPIAPEVMEPVSAFFEIGPSGPLADAMSVRLPLKRTVDAEDDEYLITTLSAESPSGPWAALPTTIAPDGRYVTAVTTHLSLFVVVRTWIGKVVNGAVSRVKSFLGAARQVFDGLTSDVFAEAKPPQCPDVTGARTDGYTASSSGQQALLWCFGRQDGSRMVKVVGNRRYL